MCFGFFHFFTASKFISLFFNHADKVFFGVLYFKGTFDLRLPSPTSFSALYLSLIDFEFKFLLAGIVAITQISAYRKQRCTLYTRQKTFEKKISNARTSFENSIVNDSLCAFRFKFKRSKETKEKTCLQDKFSIFLIITLELNTFIKRYHVILPLIKKF